MDIRGAVIGSLYKDELEYCSITWGHHRNVARSARSVGNVMLVVMKKFGHNGEVAMKIVEHWKRHICEGDRWGS